jgi:hypothetical protein
MRKLIRGVVDTSGAVAQLYRFPVAEAYHELCRGIERSPGAVQPLHDAVNLIGSVGLCQLPTTLTKEQFRTRVRNERDIELSFEDHRLWTFAAGWLPKKKAYMQGKLYGLRIFRSRTIPPNSGTALREETRTFARRMSCIHFF